MDPNTSHGLTAGVFENTSCLLSAHRLPCASLWLPTAGAPADHRFPDNSALEQAFRELEAALVGLSYN